MPLLSGAGATQSGASTVRCGAGATQSGASTVRCGAGATQSGASTVRCGAGATQSGASTVRCGAGVIQSSTKSFLSGKVYELTMPTSDRHRRVKGHQWSFQPSPIQSSPVQSTYSIFPGLIKGTTMCYMREYSNGMVITAWPTMPLCYFMHP